MSLKTKDPFDVSLLSAPDDGINPYVQKLRDVLHGSLALPIIFGDRLKSCRNHWRQTIRSFGAQSIPQPDKARLVVEIGCHFGLTLQQLAKQNSTDLFVGIDITYKRVFRTAERLARDGAANACSAMFNARYFEAIFGEEEIDALLIYFPDPWQKKAKQAKHRLLSDSFLHSAHRCLSPGGILCFKTDAKEYFDATCQKAKSLGFGVVRDHPWGTCLLAPVTTFELKFKQSNVQTYSEVFVKLAESVEKTTESTRRLNGI
jgi:tRNA (guanine-N(7)-)-methyltransferase